MTESSFRRLLLRFALLPTFSFCVFLALLGYEIHEIYILRIAGAQATTALLDSYQLQKSIVDEETGVRGYLASNDSTFLQPYNEASHRFSREYLEIRELASTDPTLSAQVANIGKDYDRFNGASQLLVSGNSGQNGSPIDLLREQKEAMDALRADFMQLDAERTRIRETNIAQLNRLFARLPVIGIGSGILITTLLIWYAAVLFREISRAYSKQLQETEFKRDSLDTTLQSIGDGVMVCDASGNITMMNRAAEALTGWTNEEANGRALHDVFRTINEGTRTPLESPLEQVRRANGVVTLENHTRLVRKDGAEIPIDDSGAPIRDRDGSRMGMVLVFRSVQLRRQAAMLMRQSQERLNSIYNTSLEYIGILSVKGRVLDCNRASLEFAGNTREDVVGKYYWECPWFIHTEGMPDTIRAAVERGAAGHPTRVNIALKRPNGETIDFDFSLTPVVDAEGNVKYLVPEGRDISELKRAQLALIQSEKLAAVGRLASSIAHEINNPLEAVMNLIYLASSAELGPETAELLKTADHELRRVSVIANQTLRFHKQASGAEPLLTAELFSAVLGIYEGRLRNANISVELSDRAREPVVCFAGDVRQVLSNLIGNAIDAMSNRGGRLLLRSHLATDWPGDRKGVVLTVADTGSGISSDDVERIFEPFFTTKGAGGTGLGLWVSKEVATRHNGTLKVRSSDSPERPGTVFRFFLPMSEC